MHWCGWSWGLIVVIVIAYLVGVKFPGVGQRALGTIGV
jgi:hypothetical protein